MIAWPSDLRPTGLSIWLEEGTLRAESPLSFATQVVSRGVARWNAQLEFNPVDRARAGRIAGLIAAAKGGEVPILLWDFSAETPLGTAAVHPGGALVTSWISGTSWGGGTNWASVTPPSTPQLRQASAKGATRLETWGWKAGDLVLRAGDRIGLDARMYMVTDDALANGTTQATFTISPPLRADAGIGAALVLTRPASPFRLIDGQQGRAQVRPGGPFWAFSLSLVESLP